MPPPPPYNLGLKWATQYLMPGFEKFCFCRSMSSMASIIHSYFDFLASRWYSADEIGPESLPMI